VTVILDVVTSALFIAGTLLALIASVGINVMPDIYARLHAATKPATLSAALTLVGASLQVGDWEAVSKLMLALALQLTAAPIAAHVLSRASHDAGAELSADTIVDELQADQSSREET
jgi:multicomponent Na+:H+ antiporter subunit G